MRSLLLVVEPAKCEMVGRADRSVRVPFLSTQIPVFSLSKWIMFGNELCLLQIKRIELRQMNAGSRVVSMGRDR